ncbi:AbrB family transcriptional regulator [Bacillus sp. FJAT-50079]|uniref:AbrB family transcriptional regulator n=1 Tax=Bacillus sp. FJAT-50079 TaxID=2833577 RepID=UPI001BCA1685|nr:AbrB family transcriptional regulator [Bacillus sp. FJAT-50079]
MQSKKLTQIIFFLLSGLSGYLFSLTGISIGWMVGSLFAAGILSVWRPSWLIKDVNAAIIPKQWMFFGQWILGVELGQKINTNVLNIFMENWLFVCIILLVSVLFSLLSGMILWRFSQTDMLTSLIGTAPGGISYLPVFAEEVGANIATVSIIQIVRVLLVIGTMPFLVFYWTSNHYIGAMNEQTAIVSFALPEASLIIWTVIIVLVAAGGSFLARFLKLPTPWLLGSMVIIALLQTVSFGPAGGEIWWPSSILILSQIMIGTSIGSRLNKQLFVGLKRILLVSSLSSIVLIIVMVLCATLVSKLTEISWITAILAFAPGGIAEMAVTAVTLNADSTFVVAVQVLRIAVVIMLLPPLFQLVERKLSKSKQTIV